MRGDNAAFPNVNAQCVGTPPRAWGQPIVGWPVSRFNRNTPTCVGTTLSHSKVTGVSPEHPHVRGDNALKAILDESDSGTPPRAWGQRCNHEQISFVLRNTPTCVGTTLTNPLLLSSKKGTPPRAWGQRDKRAQEFAETRNTPTCVGTTVPAQRLPPGRKEHPHVRGDNDR